jgi:hypothetical protein
MNMNLINVSEETGFLLREPCIYLYLNRAIALFPGDKLLGSNKYEITEALINDYSLQMNLRILNVQKHDFGGYLCSSVNALGKVEGSVRLQGK